MIYQSEHGFFKFLYKAEWSTEEGSSWQYIVDKKEFEKNLLTKLERHNRMNRKIDNIDEEENGELILPEITYTELVFSTGQNERFEEIKNMKNLTLREAKDYIISNIEPRNPHYQSVKLQKENSEIKPLALRVKTATEIYEENINNENLNIDDFKTLRIAKLKEECSNAIYEGFISGENVFGLNELDQANFTQEMLLIVAGLTSPIIEWKTKNSGVVELTTEEFKNIIACAKTHKRNQQSKYWVLEQQILNSTSINEIKSINWD